MQARHTVFVYHDGQQKNAPRLYRYLRRPSDTQMDSARMRRDHAGRVYRIIQTDLSTHIAERESERERVMRVRDLTTRTRVRVRAQKIGLGDVFCMMIVMTDTILLSVSQLMLMLMLLLRRLL